MGHHQMLMFMILPPQISSTWLKLNAHTNIVNFIQKMPHSREISAANFQPAQMEQVMELKRKHPYYSQIQGQLAITDRKWCDLVVYTKKGIFIERIENDTDFWENELLSKLTAFYDGCLCPSIVAPIHLIGMKVHDLRAE